MPQGPPVSTHEEPPVVPALGALRLLIVLGACVVFGSVCLMYPFGRDQGSYAYSAWALLHGQMLYSDVFVFKPPMTSLVHALALVLFGHSMTSIRVLDILWVAATALVLARCAAHLFRDREAALVTGLLVPFFHFLMGWWSTAQTDPWMGLPAGLSLLLVLEARRFPARRVPLAFASGVMLGVALLFKYVAVLFVPALLLVVAPPHRRDLRQAVAPVLAGVAGAGTMAAACVGWLVARGAWAAFVDTQFHLVPGYVASASVFTPMGMVQWWLRRLWVAPEYQPHLLAVPGVAVVARAVWQHGVRTGPMVAALWLAAGMGCYFSQRRMFDYHAMAMIPGLALVGGLGIAAVGRAVGTVVKTPSLRRLLQVGVPLLLLGKTSYVHTLPALIRLVDSGETMEAYWLRTRYGVSDYSVANSVAAGITVRMNTAPDDPIFVWGFDATIPFVAERRVTSRFLYNYPFAVRWGNVGAYGPELLRALEAEPPALFIVASDDAMPQVTNQSLDSRALLEGWPELLAIVDTQYTRVADVGRYRIHRRIPSPPPD